ncbi:MAG: ATP-dependent zinc metalloprotease FtsH, partial [Saprospiraceae bacterium]
MAQANKPTKPSGSPKLPGFPQGKKPEDGKRAIPWLWIAFGAFFVLQIAFSFFTTKGETISYTELMALLRTEDVAKVTVVNQSTAEVYIKEDQLTQPKYEKLPQTTNRPQYEVEIGSVDAFTEALNGIQQDRAEGDKLQVTFLERPDYLGVILSWVIPIGLLLLLWVFLMNRARSNMGGMGGPNGIFNFGKSKAKLVDQSEEKVTFDDVAGLNEIKVEVGEVVDFLKNKEKYTSLGAKIPRGVLLIGPPGTGKTLLARAVAGEAGVPFYSISGSEFVEMFVGVGASRVRDLFKTAKENSPSIVFIDEIDAVGRSRGAANAMQSNDERESTLNQMLTEMDGFGANTGVIVMGATNRGEVLDSALLRPGRFDRQIYLELPTKQEREEILKVHTRDIKLDGEIDLDQLASQTPGFSGADLANLCNEAALIAARHDKPGVQMQDFLSAADRIIGGLENKSRVITDREKEIIAYHEAGHATASWYLEHADALLKVSIVPRGKSL